MSKILVIIGLIMMTIGFSRIVHASDVITCEMLDYKCENDRLVVDDSLNLEQINNSLELPLKESYKP